MKKTMLCILGTAAALLPALLLAGCGKKQDYSAHISEVRSDIFIAETEEFSLTLFCSEREYPYADDGVACPRSKLAEISLVAKEEADYFVYVTGDEGFGGETSYRNVRGDHYFSQGVETFPEGSVKMRVEWGDKVREVVATSVRTEKTISPQEALQAAVGHEEEALSRMTQDGEFFGEFRVRLLRRDATYYYVGIVDKTGKSICLLLSSETGEVLARRESG